MVATIYEAIEKLLGTIVPEGCRIFQANMPLQVMNALERESAKLCTYLVFQDRPRVNSSGKTPVHEVIIEVSFYGSLDDVNQMSADLQALTIGQEVSSEGWRFVLVPGQNGKRDVWEPRIQVKREYLQLTGFAIEPDAAS